MEKQGQRNRVKETRFQQCNSRSIVLSITDQTSRANAKAFAGSPANGLLKHTESNEKGRAVKQRFEISNLRSAIVRFGRMRSHVFTHSVVKTIPYATQQESSAHVNLDRWKIGKGFDRIRQRRKEIGKKERETEKNMAKKRNRLG